MTTDSAFCTQTFDDLRICGWQILLAARKLVDTDAPNGAVTLHYENATRTVEVVPGIQAEGQLTYSADHQWQYLQQLPETIRMMFDLYLPVLGSHASPSVVIGHLGQSVDAQIATVGGDSFFVTGEENRNHLHRLRALSHAVIVGAETVLADDPKLNTRTVPGPSPIRVVIDPQGRVPSNAGVLNDEAAPTWLFHSTSRSHVDEQSHPLVTRIALDKVEGRFPMKDIIAALAQRGVTRLFVEGGGVTVSNMLKQNCLHLLQVAAAPVLVGEGRPAIQLPGIDTMKNALRPPFQLYRMGEDVLWNFDVRNIDIANGESQDTSKETIENADVPAFQRLL